MNFTTSHLRANTNTKERGHALITSLLILIVMNLMAVGIMQVSLRISKSATYKTIDSEVFHVTDSCHDEVMTWLEAQTSAPTSPSVFSKSDLNFMMTGSETTAMRNVLTGYNYNCNLEYLLSEAPDAGQSQNTGDNVGGGSGYGVTGSLSQKYYYKITSTGGGPKSSSKVINTIVSAEY